MSRAKYFRQKKKIESMKLERMQHIAMYFQDQHLERIDRVELIEKLMWDSYFVEKDPTKKVGILGNILSMQAYISAYYDTTRYVLEQKVKTYSEVEKAPPTYLSINVRHSREEERKEEREKELRRMYMEREEQTRLENNNNEPLPGIGDEDEDNTPAPIEHSFSPAISASSDLEEPIEEEQESEQDRYWKTHKPRYRPNNNGVHYTS